MGKWATFDHEIMPAPAGTDIAAELRAAERKRVADVTRLAGEVTDAMRAENYSLALERAQEMCTSIVHASNAAQLVARYGHFGKGGES